MEQCLIGVDGSPLLSLWASRSTLDTQFPITILVVSLLTIEAILGLDSLQQNSYVIDLGGERATSGKGASHTGSLSQGS